MKKYYDNDIIDQIDYLSDCGNFDAALALLDEYRAKYPEDKMHNIAYADILCNMKRYDEAEALLKDILLDRFRNDKIKSRALGIMSSVCYFQKKYEEAKTYIIEAYELSGRKHYHNLKLLCDLYTKQGDFESAKNVIYSYKTSENEDHLNLIMAEILYNEGKYSNSLAVLKQINTLQLNTIEMQRYEYLTGKSYYFIKDIDTATIHFKKALTIKNIFYWVSYFYLACIKAKKGLIDDAIYMCEDILKHEKTIFGLNDTLAALYLKKQNPQKSISIIDNIEDEGNKSFNKAKFLLQQGDFKSAEKEALKAIPNLELGFRDKAKYLLAICLFKQGKYEETLSVIDEIKNVSDDIKSDILRIKYYITYINGNALKPSSYTAQQINEYQEKLALSHIYQRHASDFNPNVDISDLFYNVQNSLDRNYMDNLKSFDIYLVQMDNVGNENNNNTSVLKVVCIPKTTKILTMFPDNSMDNLKDDLYIDEEDIKPKKKKTLSQIDKFNKKYNLT